jgi:hypothetical protein
MKDVRFDHGRDPIQRSAPRNYNIGWITGTVAAAVITILGLYAFVYQRWSRLSEQNLRVDKWSVCRG